MKKRSFNGVQRTMRILGKIRSWWRRSLRRQFLIPTIGIVVTSLGALGYWSFQIGQASVRREVYVHNGHMAILVARDIHAHINGILDTIRLFMTQTQASTDIQSYQARIMLELRQGSPLTYRAFYIFDHAGNLTLHLAESLEELEHIRHLMEITRRLPILVSADIRTAYAAAANGGLYISPVTIVGADQVPIMILGLSISTPGTHEHQVVVAEVDLRSVWRQIDDIRMGKTGRVFVVSDAGIILAHPNRRYIGQRLTSELLPVTQGYEGQVEYADPLTGRMLFASYTPVGKLLGWGIIVEQAQAEAFASINAIAVATFRVLAIAIVIATGMMIVTARSVIQPIYRLILTTETISRTGALTQPVPVDHEDEVGRLGATFNLMLDRLQQSQQEVLTLNKELEERVIERTAQLGAANNDLREAQEQLVRREKLAVLGQMAGSVGHELRTPLATISNAVYYLTMVLSNADETTREYLDIIGSEVRRAEKIIADLLDFSRVKSLNRQAVQVADVVALVLAKTAPPDTIRVTTDIPADLPPILVDPTHLEQVLHNLISNACQAMPQGGTLSVICKQCSLLSEYCLQMTEHCLLITVSDTGCGIAPEHLETIFEPLFTTKPKGIGLGLAVCKNLVEANGGTLGVTSHENHGTTFTLVFPMKEISA